MKRLWLLVAVLNGLWWAALQAPARAPNLQVATPTLPTLRAEAYDQDVNVRSGPGTDYDRVGTLVRGQSGAIIGQSLTRGVWLKIVYIGGPENTGWVSQDVVKVIGDLGQAPTVAPPPTPTLPPLATAPISTTLAAPSSPELGQLPTFTAPAPAAFPTLLPVQGLREDSRFPPAILIISLFVIGGFGTLLSLIRRR